GIVAQQAEQHPQALAAVAGGRQLSYGELNRRANQWAHYLVKQGVKPGTPVGVWLEPGMDWLVVAVGVLKAGGVLAGVEAGEPVTRVMKMLERGGAAVTITEKRVAERLAAAAPVALLVREAHQAGAAKEKEHGEELQ